MAFGEDLAKIRELTVRIHSELLGARAGGPGVNHTSVLETVEDLLLHLLGLLERLEGRVVRLEAERSYLRRRL